jgi:hypothetical protein
MQFTRVDHPGESRLRFVFDDRAVSFGLAAEVAFGEVAPTSGELSGRRYGSPVAIDVTVGSRGAGSGRGPSSRPGGSA